MNAPIWVTLPHLPFEIWCQKVFEVIASSFEKLITVDEVTKAWIRLIEVRICIMVEFETKLPIIVMIKSKLGE